VIDLLQLGHHRHGQALCIAYWQRKKKTALKEKSGLGMFQDIQIGLITT